MNMGQRIAMYREAAGMSQTELAQKLGVTPQAVNKWEHGVSYPTPRNLYAMARIFGCSIDDLNDEPVPVGAGGGSG